jgi:hypothetical protein
MQVWNWRCAGVASAGQSRRPYTVVESGAMADARSDDGGLFVPCHYSGSLSALLGRAAGGDTTLAARATVTVAMPAGPHCGPYEDGRERPILGYVVHLNSDGNRTRPGHD